MKGTIESVIDDMLAGLRDSRRQLDSLPILDLLQPAEPFPNLEAPNFQTRQPFIEIPHPPRMIRRAKPNAYRAGFVRLAEPLLFSLRELALDDD